MVVIGVTGGVGTGKSTVARLFARLGAAVLDADAIAHQAMAPGRAARRQVLRAFGRGILNPDGTINRRRLAELVFRDRRRRRRLERIVHPHVIRQIRRQIHRLRREGRVRAVVLDVPLLLEAGAQGLADALVVVTAPPTVQRRRLARARGWTPEEVARRSTAQWGASAKAALADVVVDNARGMEATRTQVTQIWNQLVPRNSTRSSSTTSSIRHPTRRRNRSSTSRR
jgi:dephospho-CoA kinase